MKVLLKLPFFSQGNMYLSGVNEIPEGTVLPSSAELLDDNYVVVVEAEVVEPDTLSGLAAKTPKVVGK